MGIETIFMLCLKEDCMILNRHAGSRMFEIFLWEELPKQTAPNLWYYGHPISRWLGIWNFNFFRILRVLRENIKSGWWFQLLFIFTPKIGEDEPILAHIFQRGWFNHQLEIKGE